MFQAGTTTINVNQPTAYHARFCSQTVKTRKMDSGFNKKEVSLLCIWFVRTTELLKQGPVREMMHGRHKHTLITENVNIFLLFQTKINSNGYMPSCKGVADGTYLTTPVRCDVFYPCFNGTAYALRCANGLVFDVTLSTCVLETTTCTSVR